MDLKKLTMYGAATLLIVIALGYIVNRRSNVVTAGA